MIGYSTKKGFFMQIKHVKNQPPIKLPSIFYDVNVTKNYVSFTSNDMMKLNCRAGQAIEEIYLQSDCIISQLINDIRAKISCFYTLTDIVANVDLVFSFAYQSSCSNYIRPNFGNYIEILNVSICLSNCFLSFFFVSLVYFIVGHSSCTGENFLVGAQQSPNKWWPKLPYHYRAEYERQDDFSQANGTFANNGSDWLLCARGIGHLSHMW